MTYCSSESGGERKEEAQREVPLIATGKIAPAAAHPSEYFSDHQLKMSFPLHGRHSSSVTFMLGYAATVTHALKVESTF